MWANILCKYHQLTSNIYLLTLARYAVHENVVFHVVERSRLVAGLVQLLVGCFCAEWQMYEPSLDSFKSIACRHLLRNRPGFQHCLEALDFPTEHHLDRVQLLQLVRTLAGEHIVEQRNTRSFILVQLPLTVCAYQFAECRPTRLRGRSSTRHCRFCNVIN